MPSRRRSQRRRATAPRRGARVIVLALIALLLIGAVVVARQFAGYFSGLRTPRQVAATAAPATTRPAPASPRAAAPSAVPAAGPRIAIIIDDCGYDLPNDLRFVRLPIPVTLSILPLTPHGKEVAAAANAAGKPVMLHIPMEPLSAGAHPGPGEISTAMSDDQIRAQLSTDIASLPPMPGANNHMGSKATSDPRVMRDVIDQLKADGMFFIDSMTALTSVGSTTARDAGVPTAARDVFLDNQATVPYVEGQLRALAAVARRHGSAIAIGHPNPQTAQALEAMIPRLEAEGFVFVAAQSLTK